MGILFDIVQNLGHYDAYIGGKFHCSADNLSEASKEVEMVLEEGREEE